MTAAYLDDLDRRLRSPQRKSTQAVWKTLLIEAADALRSERKRIAPEDHLTRTIDALVKSANASTTDESWKWAKEAAALWKERK